MNIFLKGLLFSGLLLFSFVATAQQDEVYDDEIPDEQIDLTKEDESRQNGKIRKRRKFNPENVYIASGVGLDFWGTTFSAHLSPHIGYRIGGFLLPAAGLTYTYIYDFQWQSNIHVFGPKALIRVAPFPNAPWYLHAEGEYLRIAESNPSFNPNVANGQPRYYESVQPRFNVGLGYSSNLGEGAGFMTEFLFDLYFLQTGATYLNPFTYRIGFYYGF